MWPTSRNFARIASTTVNILDAIPLASLVALDTVVWIYEFEFHPIFGPVTRKLFREGFDKAVCRAACSLLVSGGSARQAARPVPNGPGRSLPSDHLTGPRLGGLAD